MPRLPIPVTPLPDRECRRCGKIYQPPNKQSRYCGPACYTQDLYERATAKRHAKASHARWRVTERECLHCKRAFLPHWHAAYTCSPECKAQRKAAMWRARYDRCRGKSQQRQCTVCDKVFVADPVHCRALTCSIDCSAEHYRRWRVQYRQSLKADSDPETIKAINAKGKAGHIRRKQLGLVQPAATECKICTGPIPAERQAIRCKTCSIACEGTARTYRVRVKGAACQQAR